MATARYVVKAGHVLPHDGRVCHAGEVVELEDRVAADHEVRYRVERLDDAPSQDSAASGPAADPAAASETASEEPVSRAKSRNRQPSAADPAAASEEQ